MGEFKEDGNWILPVSGTFGNKARELYKNTPIIHANGAKVPRSLVVPFEYLNDPNTITKYTLELADRYFPGWLRILVRSNAPDEDVGLRFPGLYTSEDLWHNDGDKQGYLLFRVIDSYKNPAAVARRKQLGLPELGMCLLIMELINNTPGEFDANYAGCFSDIGENAILTFNNPKKGLEAMISKPIKRLRIDGSGNPIDSFTPQERDFAYRLRKLSDELPKKEGKGWSIEFVANSDGLYIVQTTPIRKTGRVEIPSSIDNIFNSAEVVGAGEFSTDGILYVPVHADKRILLEFDRTHINYCLALYPSNISMKNTDNILQYLLNPAVILSLEYDYERLHSLSEHMRQYMREGRITLAGIFENPDMGNVHFGQRTNFVGREKDFRIREPIYSPTELVVVGDEFSQKAVVGLKGLFQDFVKI